ncbi:MAG: hypothetical protein GX575_09690 [Candidatus Anammoximicrobium sp.]|nr:hypothetical protein [Candidatus Anammoximicrobium sp.]
MARELGSLNRREFCKAAAALAALGSAAQGGQPDKTGSGLKVAAFRSDATPPLGMPIYPSYRPLEKIEHPLLAKGVVLDDGRQRCVLCAVDWCILSNSTRDDLRRKAAEAADTDVSRVTIHVVHQHSAPAVDADAQRVLETIENPPPYLDLRFVAAVGDRLAAAVREAAGRLQDADRVGTGQAQVDRVASSRRIVTADGKLHGRNSAGGRNPALAALPEGLIDPLLKTVTLARGDKPLVRLHYYATHPQSFYGDPRVSFDFVGLAREQLEQDEGVPQVYFTGCGGDVAAGKYNDGTPRARDELRGRLLAGMKAAAAATRFEPAGSVQWRTLPLALPVKTSRGFSLPELRAKMADAKELPHLRILAARRIAFHQRIERPLELSALHCGRVRLLHLPGEPMVAFQLYAQQFRPDDFVAVAGYGDGCTNYICTEQAFQEGGYEPSASTVGPQSEALLKDAIRRLLGADVA